MIVKDKDFILTIQLFLPDWPQRRFFMRSWKIRLRPAALGEKLQRAYRYSELRKLQLWFKGKTLHWAVYLASALVLVGAAMTLHHYYSCFFYVVSVGRGKR